MPLFHSGTKEEEAMPELGSQARVTVSGGARVSDHPVDSLPDISPDKLPSTAWWLYEHVLERAKNRRGGAKQQLHDGVVGYLWEGNVNSLYGEAWPLLSRDPDDKEAKEAKLALNIYLRKSKNLICLNRGNQVTPSTWWVRAVWSPESVSLTTLPRETPPPVVKVTPAEAGEYREPAPVETSYFCPECKEPFKDPAGVTNHFTSAHMDRFALALEAVASVGPDATVQAVFTYMQGKGLPGTMDVARRALEALYQEEKLIRRTGTRGTLLYNIPGRTKQERQVQEKGWGPYPCREEGCGAEPFATSDERRAHEDSQHPYSNRPYICPVSDCDQGRDGQRARTYNLAGMARHISQGHRFPRESEVYRRLMDNVGAQAAALAQPRPVVPAPAPVARREPEPVRVPEMPVAAPVQQRGLTVPERPVEPTKVTNGRDKVAEDAVRGLYAVLDENKQLRAKVQDYEGIEEEVVVLRRENRSLRTRLGNIQNMLKGDDG